MNEVNVSRKKDLSTRRCRHHEPVCEEEKEVVATRNEPSSLSGTHHGPKSRVWNAEEER
jgi:hypothetical protein